MATIQPLSGGDGVTGESGQDSRDKINLSILEANKVVDKAEALIDIVKVNTNYTLLESDNGKRVQCTLGTLITITLPDGLSTGFNCQIENAGTGDVAIVAATTFRSAKDYDRIYTQYQVINVYHTGSNNFTVDGLEQDPDEKSAEDLVQPLEQLEATGVQTLTVTSGYSINQIYIEWVSNDSAFISPDVEIGISSPTRDDVIMKLKNFTEVERPYVHLSRAYITPAGTTADWTIYTTVTGGTVNIYIQTSKLL